MVDEVITAMYSMINELEKAKEADEAVLWPDAASAARGLGITPAIFNLYVDQIPYIEPNDDKQHRRMYHKETVREFFKNIQKLA